MKIIPEHVAELKELLNNNNITIAPYSVYQDQGLSPMRWRWDHIWCIPAAQRGEWFNKVYDYANDDHIDTVLRRLLK